MKTYTLYETSSEKSATGNREQIARELIADLWADGSRAETFGTLEEAIDRAEELNLTQTHACEFVGHGGVHYVHLAGACIDEEDEETGAIETVWYSDDDRAKEWLDAWARRGYHVTLNVRRNGFESVYENYVMSSAEIEELENGADWSFLEPDNGYWFYRNEDTGEEICGYQNSAE